MAESLTGVYYVQSMSENLDNSLIESSITNIEALMSLPGLRNLTMVYLSTLPDVMIEYQRARSNWLDNYGYDIDIKNNELKEEVNRRLNLLN